MAGNGGSRMITSWSISRLNTYMACPARAKYKFIDKKKEPGSAAMDRGSALHKQAEIYLKVGGRIPKELKLIGPNLKDFRKRGALAEADFTFRKDWTSTKWDDWSGAWCRVKADVIVPPLADAKEPEVEVHDFKSGRLKEGAEEYTLQLELYGLAGLLTYPTAAVAKTSLVFIDHGKTVEGPPVVQKDVPILKKAWEVRVKKMLSDTVFKPTPGNECRWCTFSKAKGGPCDF